MNNGSASAEPLDLRTRRANRTSQDGEDGITSAIFETIGVRRNVCVDVGAHDLVRFSNTHQLWRDRGWRAVLIEGNPRFFRRMLHQHNGVHDLTLINRYVSWTGVNTLERILEPLKMPCDFDFLSIDVDGPDYHIWQSFSNYRPRVVVIEYNSTIPPTIELVGIEQNYVGASALSFLKLGNAKGYALVACTGSNLFFVVDEYSSAFLHANNLAELFDYRNVCYAMTSYDGGLFFSNAHMPYPFNVWSNEVRGKITDPERFAVLTMSPTHLLRQWARERLRRLRHRR